MLVVEKAILTGRRARIQEIIFESDTPAGKLFDEALIVAIILSVIIVMLDSVQSMNAAYGNALYFAEWLFTLVFTVEYILRLVCVGRPARYAVSFFGLIDLFSIVPTYLSLLLPGAQYFLVLRLLRVLRIFRVLKLVHYPGEAGILLSALRASRAKIVVFLFAVLTLDAVFCKHCGAQL